jgi:hypothetical protein
LLDFDETTVKVARAFPLLVNFNSGSATRFPVIVIGALMRISHSVLVWLLCLVFFLSYRVL